MKIGFVSAKRYSFCPLDYEQRGLGGTESMLVLLSRALAKRGHDVHVFNCCYRTGVYNNVSWRNLWEFEEGEEEFDIIISLRLLEIFSQKITAKIQGVWIHDETLPGASVLDNNPINLWIFVSETQRDFVCKGEALEKKNIYISRNALDQDLYNASFENTQKVMGQTIYCSAPDRGLDVLLEMWPEIKKQVPYATLKITGSFALWGNADEENARFFKKIYTQARALDGVTLLGRVSKSELVILQTQSELMLYPTHFNEMFCISALECLSVGTPVISSKRAAMCERISHNKTGIIIDGNPKSILYKNNFIKATVDLLKNSTKKNTFAIKARADNEKMNFNNLAKDWERELQNRLNKL